MKTKQNNILETTKLSRLPKLPVRNSLENKEMLRENVYPFDEPDLAVFSNEIIPDRALGNKIGATIIIECDSICHPNPGGIACFAWVAFNEKREIIEKCYKTIGRGKGITNNVVEYHSVISALEWAWSRDEEVKVFTSSQLIFKQISGKWECKSELLKPLLETTILCIEATLASVEWKPQKKNKTASYFCNLAYEKAKQDIKGGLNE